MQAYCDGVRAKSRREFLHGIPPFLVPSLDVFARQGLLHVSSQLPDSVEVLNERYILCIS